MASKPKILIADDEPRIRSVLSLKLKLSGYEVTAVTSAQAVLDVLEEVRPDLIMTDFRMPGTMTGVDMIRRLRTLPEFRDIPVILLTGSVAVPEKLLKELGEGAGVTLLSKPFSPRGLVELLKGLLGQ